MKHKILKNKLISIFQELNISYTSNHKVIANNGKEHILDLYIPLIPPIVFEIKHSKENSSYFKKESNKTKKLLGKMAKLVVLKIDTTKECHIEINDNLIFINTGIEDLEKSIKDFFKIILNEIKKNKEKFNNKYAPYILGLGLLVPLFPPLGLLAAAAFTSLTIANSSKDSPFKSLKNSVVKKIKETKYISDSEDFIENKDNRITIEINQFFTLLLPDESLIIPIQKEVDQLLIEEEYEHYSAAILQCGRIAEAITYNIAKAWDIPLTTSAKKQINLIVEKLAELEKKIIDISYEENSSIIKQDQIKLRGIIETLQCQLNGVLIDFGSTSTNDNKNDDNKDNKNSVEYLIGGLMKKFYKVNYKDSSTIKKELSTQKKVLSTSYQNMKTFRNIAAHAPIDGKNILTEEMYNKSKEHIINFIKSFSFIFQIINSSKL